MPPLALSGLRFAKIQIASPGVNTVHILLSIENVYLALATVKLPDYILFISEFL